MRTNCENVGTVLPQSAAIIFPKRKHPQSAQNTRLPQCAQTQARERIALLKGILRIRRNHPSKKLRTQSGSRTLLPASTRRGLLGFAGLAPHSGRSSVPFHRSCSGTEDIPSNYNYEANLAPTNNEV